MPKHSHKRKRLHRRKSRSHGGSYTSMLSSAIVPGYPVIGRNLIGPDCLAASRPGMLSSPFGGEGLPGMRGGSQCGLGVPASPLQSGGRYEVSLEGAPTNGLASVNRIPCEASRSGLRGGGQPGAPDIRHDEQRAGYTNDVISVGGRNLMIQTPVAGNMNPSCLRGGSRRHKRRHLKKRKATRKHKSKRHH
jgi:hypothetical protein